MRPGYRFATFELDAEAGELRRDGRRVHLPHQPLRLLALLLERPGRVVSRDEIRNAVWDGTTHVDFDQSINTYVRQVRHALGDDAASPRFVQTVPRRGYRFLADVEPLAGSAREPRVRPRGLAAAAGLTLLVLLAVAALAPRGGPTTGRGDARPVVAVLPFENYGEDDANGWLGDALTEELIAQLGRRYADRMLVIARTSSMHFREGDHTLPEIAERLGADYLLEGSLRAEGDRLRVTAQLIRASDASHLWAANYDRRFDRTLDLQIELCDRIADALAIQLLDGDLAEPIPTADPALYRDYLRARSLVSERLPDGLAEARTILSDVVEQDPGFAAAWTALAHANAASFEPEHRSAARDALRRALALDEAQPRAHLLLAEIRFYRDYDLAGARAAWERAIELNPTFAEAHHAFAAYWSVIGDHDAAIESVQRARRLDPLASMVRSDLGWYYYFAREFDLAILYSRRTLELDPGFYWAELCIQLSLLRTGATDDLVARGRELIERAEPEAPELASIAAEDRPYDAARAVWRWRLRRMEALHERGIVPPSSLGQLTMVLGDHERTLDLLEQSFEHRVGWILPFLAVDPLFDPLRGDPRFDDLLARIAGDRGAVGRITSTRRGSTP